MSTSQSCLMKSLKKWLEIKGMEDDEPKEEEKPEEKRKTKDKKQKKQMQKENL